MLTPSEYKQLAEVDRRMTLKALLNTTSIMLTDAIDSRDIEIVKTLFELYCKFSEDLKMLDKCNKL